MAVPEGERLEKKEATILDLSIRTLRLVYGLRTDLDSVTLRNKPEEKLKGHETPVNTLDEIIVNIQEANAKVEELSKDLNRLVYSKIL